MEGEYKIETLVKKYWNRSKGSYNNIHFHDPYVDPQENVDHTSNKSNKEVKAEVWVDFLNIFNQRYFSEYISSLMNSYDIIRPGNKFTRFFVHFTTMPLLAVSISVSLVIDTIVQAAGLVVNFGLLLFCIVYRPVEKKGPYYFSVVGKELGSNLFKFLYNFRLMLRCFPALYDPSYIANELIPQKSEYAISGGGLYKTKIKIRYPKTEAELEHIVNFAKNNNKIVSVVGSGMSQGQQFLAVNKDNLFVISLKNLKLKEEEDVKISYGDGNEAYATCNAKCTWAEVQDVINNAGYALPVMQASNIFSVGGSVSTNIHGWNHRLGSLSNHIYSIRYINGNGKIQNITNSDPMFKYLVGGFGSFGIILDVKIKLIDNVKVKLKAEKNKTLSSYIEYFKKEVNKKDGNVSLHIGRLDIANPKEWGNNSYCSVTPSNYNKVQGEAKIATKKPLYREKKGGEPILRIGLNLISRFKNFRRIYMKQEIKSDSSENNPEQTLNETCNFAIQPLIRSKDSSHQFWLQEYFLPEDQIESFTRELGKILHDNYVPLVNASIRFVKKEDDDHKTAMSYTADKSQNQSLYKSQDTYALVICFNQKLSPQACDETHKWVQKTFDQLIKHKGSMYLPYQQHASNEQLQVAYPMASNIIEMYEQDFPDVSHQFFSNGLKQMLLHPNPDIDIVPNLDKMKSFFDIVFKQHDFANFRQVYSKVRNMNLTSREEFYNELQKNLPSNLLKSIEALKDIQKDISVQVAEILNESKKIGYKTKYTSTSRIRNHLSKSSAKLKKKNTDESIDEFKMLEIGTHNRFASRVYKELTGKNIPKKNIHTAGVDDEENNPVLRSLEQGSPLPLFGVKPYFIDEKGKAKYSLDYSDTSKFCKALNKSESSYNIVTCFAGLHHFTPEGIDHVIQEISKSLKSGGTFFLVEHNVEEGNPGGDTFNAAVAAHSIFNIGSNETFAVDKDEIRDFHSVEEWVKRVERNSNGTLKAIRDKNGKIIKKVRSTKDKKGNYKEDPSKNTMVGFRKI